MPYNLLMMSQCTHFFANKVVPINMRISWTPGTEKDLASHCNMSPLALSNHHFRMRMKIRRYVTNYR